MKLTNRFVYKVSDWLHVRKQPIKCYLYKLVCEFHYELLNFATNFRSSEKSSEHFSEKLVEIDCNILNGLVFEYWSLVTEG